ncbi:MAG: hypothetical protein QMD14_03500, partial [Candidatus Aenigmarchaeota archaeon]|nr:hypothetical protein [Candidatus Aenigmarchaeota archaeon]
FGQAEVEIELPEELRSASEKHKELYLLIERLQGQYQEGVSLDVIVKESKSSESVAKIILTDLEEGYNQLIKTDKGYKTK